MMDRENWIKRFIAVMRHFQNHGKVMEELARIIDCDFIGTRVDGIINALLDIVIDYCGANPDAMPDEFYEELFNLMEGYDNTTDTMWTDFFKKWECYGSDE